MPTCSSRSPAVRRVLVRQTEAVDEGRQLVDEAWRQAAAMDPEAVVLVEGASDHAAVVALAARLSRDLVGDRIAVVPMEGFSGIGRFLARYGPAGRDVRLAGLCDVNEARSFAAALEREGLGRDLTEQGMAALGFHVCHDDLEDELIRALGPGAVEAVLDEVGELVSFRRFQRQPAQRGRSLDAQLRRFLGTRAGRKVRMARALVEALDPAAVPAPLLAALDH